ncbi:MAG: lactate utilization protein [Thermodesulfobacteriota bacterium]
MQDNGSDARPRSARDFWPTVLADVRKRMEANGFSAYVADDAAHARQIVMDYILPGVKPASLSWGDSLTLASTGILDELRQDPELDVIAAFDQTAPRAEIIERQRKALTVDLFLTGANAVTRDGMLVNLDMVGNRTAALAFGPRHVLVLAGRNKVVENLAQAVHRIKHQAAPANAMRHGARTPCVKTGRCEDCSSPDRICNTWTITAKCAPPGRISVILINARLGI